MKRTREFEIAWQGLKEGAHQYEYQLDDAFMAAHEAPEELHGWHAVVTLTFEKHQSFFRLHFDVGGHVTTPCDRCGDDFVLKLWDEFDLIIKLLGENDEEKQDDEDADIVFIPRSETVLDISGWLYEFTMLSLPLQRVHPELPDGANGCNPEALKLLNRLSESEADQPKNNIWKGLDAFKDKNNKN